MLLVFLSVIYGCVKDSGTPQSNKKPTIDAVNTQIVSKVISNVEENQSESTQITSSCMDNWTICAPPDFQYTETSTVEVYPGCIAEYSVDVYECENTADGVTITYIIFDNFTATPVQGSCPGLADADDVDAAYYEFLVAASIVVETEALRIMVDASKSTYDCTEYTTLLSSQFFLSTCYQTYTRYRVDSQGNQGIIIETVSCGTQCCLREAIHCYDAEDDAIKKTLYVYQTFGECEGEAPKDVFVGPGTSVGDCDHSCGDL